MDENVDVEICDVLYAFSTRRNAPWRFEPGANGLYTGETPRYTFLYVWEGGYRNHGPGGDCVTVPPGSLVLFRCGSAPYYNTYAELPSYISNISFYTRQPIPMNLKENVRMVFTPDASWKTEAYMARALKLSEERPFGWKMKLRDIVSHFLQCVMRQYYEYQQRTAVPQVFRESVALIRREIFAAPLSVNEVARRCRITPTYLIRIFNQCMGMTPKQFMDELRVEWACELLRYTDHSIDEIAELSGFSEARQMRRIFREVMGMAPREYRGETRETPF